MKSISALLGFCFIVILFVPHDAYAFTPPSPPAPNKNIYQLVVLDKKLGKFADMIEQAGLQSVFEANTGEPMTVFAPTDAALDTIPRDVMTRIEANKASLQSFVKYHIIAGSAVASGSIRGRRLSLASANGEPLAFDGSDLTKPPRVGDGALAEMDIAATNGVLHTVSGALVPSSLAQAPLPPRPPQAPPAPVAAAPAPVPVPTPAQTGTATTGTPAAATATTAAPAHLRVTTTGVAQSPGAATTTLTGSSAAPIKTTGVATAPSAAAATTSATGFELFGHKFSW